LIADLLFKKQTNNVINNYSSKIHKLKQIDGKAK